MASKPKVAFTALVVLFAAGVLPSVAQAAFPGENGLIAFSGTGIETIAPDGSSRTVVRPGGSVPVWSPDGTQIVYMSGGPPDGIYTMTAAGESRTQCPCSSFNSNGEGAYFEWPTWAPDGFRIAFTETDFLTDQMTQWVAIGRPGVGASSLTYAYQPASVDWGANNKIFFWQGQTDGGIGDEIRVLGGGDNVIRSVPFEEGGGLTVSPDGSRIAFGSQPSSGSPDRAIYRSQSDGHVVVRLSGPAPAKDSAPAWSPDGSKIVFESTRDGNSELYTMNADGSNQTRLTNTPSINEYFPDWQPIPNGYPRPKSATPTYLPMVVAYGACGSATKVHAAPLGWGSCTAQQSSGQLTVGTPDANSRLPNGGGSVRLKAVLDDTATPGDDSDLSIDVNAEDVRRKADLSDYSGELRLSAVVRATDRLNSPSPNPSGLGAATLRDVTFGPAVPCTPTDDPASTVVGSTCSISTTVNTLIPGLIVGGARAIWQLDQVNLNDGGPDSDGDTAGDNTPFMRQGLFAP